MISTELDYADLAVTPAAASEWRARPVLRRRTSPGTSLMLYGLALLFPIQRDIGGVNMSLGDIIVGILAAILVFRFLTARVPLPPFLLPLTAFGVVVAISVFVNTIDAAPYFDFRDGVVEGIKLLAVILWLFAMFSLLRVDLQRRFLKFAATSVAVGVLWSLYTVHQNVVVGVERPSGPFENPNLYGNYLVLNVALAFGVAHLLEVDPDGTYCGGAAWLHRLRSPLLICTQIALLLGIFSTGSRGTLLAYATAMAVTFRLWRPQRISIGRLIAAAFGAVILIGAVLWFFSKNPYLTKRLERTSAGEKNVDERFHLWGAAKDAFYTHPVIGIGFGQFRHYASYTHHLVAKVTHQTYLSFAAELGLPGLLVFIWFIGVVLVATMRWRLTVGSGLSTIAMAFILATGVQGFFNNVDQFRSLWIAVGLVAAIGVARREEVA